MHERDNAASVDEWRASVHATRRRLLPGQHLCRAGQPFRALYLVDAGSLKTCELAGDGREQVTGFRMRGDVVGLESIGLQRCACSTVALDVAYVWEMPYRVTMAACLKLPMMQAWLNAALASEIRNDKSWMLALGTLGADNRVAAFLVGIAERQIRLGLSPTRLALHMPRIDMANYIALKHETVSRSLSRLKQDHLIEVYRREVVIIDPRRLQYKALQSS